MDQFAFNDHDDAILLINFSSFPQIIPPQVQQLLRGNIGHYFHLAGPEYRVQVLAKVVVSPVIENNR